MERLFFDLINRDIDFNFFKEKFIKRLHRVEIEFFVEDIFRKYDYEKNTFTIFFLSKENNQKIINLVVDQSYYLKCLLENIEKLSKKNIDTNIEISLVEKLNIDDKEVFLKILNKITCFNFFLLNYNKFDYIEEEKIFIKELFANLKIETINKKSLSKKDKENIVNKTGLITPFLMATEINVKLRDENLLFFIENYKHNSDYEVMKYVFLSKNEYGRTKFNKKVYELFVKKNKYNIKDYPYKIKKDIEDCIKFNNKENINHLDYMLKLTEQLLLKNEMENF